MLLYYYIIILQHQFRSSFHHNKISTATTSSVYQSPFLHSQNTNFKFFLYISKKPYYFSYPSAVYLVLSPLSLCPSLSKQQNILYFQNLLFCLQATFPELIKTLPSPPHSYSKRSILSFYCKCPMFLSKTLSMLYLENKNLH